MRHRTARALAVIGIVLLAGLGTAAVARTPRAVAERPQAVADQAFGYLKDALATGKWDPFFGLLADNFEFWFPTGKYIGHHQGKAEAMEFFRYVSTAFPAGLRVTEVLHRSGGGTTFVFEFVDEGSLRGEPYQNRVAISLDVCGAKICGYREYFGSDGKPRQ
jgi:ketosteroid isomerase-like protein